MKFSIVTPVFNGERHIKETIESVLLQEGDFEIEYIIIDGASTDKTIKIIKEYENQLNAKQIKINSNKIDFIWISEKDTGMYSAINKGFSLATGDIYAWINSDDKYTPNAFNLISKTFKKFPQIGWLKGNTIIIDEFSKIKKINPCYIYDKKLIEAGLYGMFSTFIHQDSVFWKNTLWNKHGGIDKNLRLAGDYYLWTQFAKKNTLWSINANVSCFRKRNKQLSGDMSEYRKEQKIIYDSLKQKIGLKAKLFFKLKSKSTKKLDGIFLFAYKLLFRTKNKHYIDVDENKNMIIKSVHSYVVR